MKELFTIRNTKTAVYALAIVSIMHYNFSLGIAFVLAFILTTAYSVQNDAESKKDNKKKRNDLFFSSFYRTAGSDKIYLITYYRDHIHDKAASKGIDSERLFIEIMKIAQEDRLKLSNIEYIERLGFDCSSIFGEKTYTLLKTFVPAILSFNNYAGILSGIEKQLTKKI